MSKTLQVIMGIVVLILVAVSVYLFVQVQGMRTRLDSAQQGVGSLYRWVYDSDPLVSGRWQLIHNNFDSLRALHRLGPLPPWGGVPAQPPVCFPPQPCPPQ
jgi:hypothetical protein